MSSVIDQEMQARGVASVMVFLKGPEAAVMASAALKKAPAGTLEAADAKGSVKDLSRHFRTSETSHESQLSAAARAGYPLRATEARRMPRKAMVAPQVRYYPNLGVMFGTTTKAGLAALRSDKRVHKVAGTPALSLIRPDRRAAAAAPAKLTWALEAMKVSELWKRGFLGEGVLVGHLDTGADGKHPALKGAIAHFAEFDDFGRAVKPSPAPYDTDDHGTHTAATIAGRPVGGKSVGVAPKAKLASAIVIEGGDAIARVLGGMDWALGLGVRVLSMSLGFRGWWDDFQSLITLLRSRGVLPVFAVGNEGPGTSRSPGNYPDVLSVGAHDVKRRVAYFSSSQLFARQDDAIVPDLLMPGVDIVSARPGGGYQTMDGTSMATPHLAGLAALLMQAAPTRTIAQIEAAILESCKRPPGVLKDRGNRGIPDAVRALKALLP